MAKRQNLFARLTRLFKAGPIVKKQVKGFDSASVKSSALDVFRKSTATVYGNSLNAYGQYDRLCVDSRTKIAIPGPERYIEIQDLGKKYPNGEKFIVYAYDHDEMCIKPAWAHHPRCSGNKETVKVTFDDGTFLICTPDHPCLMRDGKYKNAEDLNAGTSMMPFYRRDFKGKSNKDGKKFVVSVEPFGKQEVWDLTVDGHENFATDTIVVHNSRYSDFCLRGDTLVYTTKGVFTIKELAEKNANDIIHVYSYDQVNNKMVIAPAHSPRITHKGEKQDLIKVNFDTGGSVTTTPNHKFMLRDGSPCEAKDLKADNALMPFNVRDLAGHGYKWIYTINKNDKSGGWTPEHVLVAEYFNRKLKPNEIVHHKDFDRGNNLIENLEIMDRYEHNRYHAQLNNKNKFGKPNEKHSQWMKENNTAKRNDITFEKILEVATETDFTMSKVKEILKVDQNVIKRRLREVGFENWLDFKSKKDYIQQSIIHESIVEETKSPEIEEILEHGKDCENIYKLCQKLSCSPNAVRRRLNSCGYGTWSDFKEKNGHEIVKGVGRTSLIDDSISYQDICNSYKQGMTYAELAKAANTTHNKVISRIKKEGFKSYHEWTEAYSNHKVSSIEHLEEKDFVYNITVPEYHNLAVGCYNKNYPKDGQVLDFTMVFQSEMEYCLHGDTKIAIPNGYKTIKELSEEYGTDKEFIVYAYDHNIGGLTPALAKQARKTRFDHAWKVVFDNGQEIIGTANHRLMKRDGTFCKIEDLKPGTSMMPFYRKDFYSENKDENSDGYRWIYTINDGWKTEHQFIAEWISDRKIQKGECVHHINYKKWDNRPENLRIMTLSEHTILHNNSDKWSEENSEWIEKFKKNHSAWMKKNNPAKRSDITFGKILELCESIGFNLYKICDALDTDPNAIKRRLRENGFQDFVTFCKAYNENWKSDSWNNKGENNPRFKNEITFQSICNVFEKAKTLNEIKKELNCSHVLITKRLKDNGFSNFTDFSKNYSNHKISSIEYYGKIDLYDLTVDGYKNFATDTIISHNTPEIASAVDIYADETVAKDEKDRSLHVYSENPKIKRLLEELFYDTLNFEFSGRSWVRNLCKYGDFFLLNDVSPKYGVINAHPIPVNEIEREEGFDPENPFAVRFRWVTEGNQVLENWQVTHFRLLGNDTFLPYGSSVLESARRIWRQLVMAEDAMLVYRIIRSPERRVFYIDVANAPPNDIPNIIENARTTLKSQEVIDKDAGRVDLRYNPWAVDIDYFIPVRGQEGGTKVDTLPGGANTTAIDDVEYIQRKLFAALKVPKAYLGFDESLGGKANLAAEDVRFARTIQQIQQVVISELNKIAAIHLAAHGYDGEDLINFRLQLSNPSTMAQQQKLELLRSRFEIAGTRPEGLLSDKYLYKEVFGMTDDSISIMEEDQIKELIRKAQMEQMGAAAAEGGGGGGLGGGMGGGGGLGGIEDLGGGDEGGEEGGEPPPEGGEDLGGGDDLFAEEEFGSERLISDDEDEIIEFGLDEGDDEYKPVNQQSQISRYRHNNLRPSRRKMKGSKGMTPTNPGDAWNHKDPHFHDVSLKRAWSAGTSVNKDGSFKLTDAIQRHMEMIEDSEIKRTRLSSETKHTIDSLSRKIPIKSNTLTDGVAEKISSLIIESDEEDNE